MGPSSNNSSDPGSGTGRDAEPVGRWMRVFAALDRLDRRWLYALLFAAVLLPFLPHLDEVFSVKVKVTGPVQSFFDEIEGMERRPGKLVIVAIDWDPQTRGENYPQTEATIRHLFRKKIPFAALTLTHLGAGFCEEIPTNLAEEYGAVYGRDWVNWGYRYGWGAYFLKPLGSDVPATLETDARGTPLRDLPIMEGVKDARSVDLVCEFTGLVGALESWLQFFQTEGHRPKFCHGCTAVSAPSSYVFLDSGQLSGLQGGMLGAAEYEQLLGVRRRGLCGMSAQTTAHAVIIALIALGNVAEFVARRRRRYLAGLLPPERAGTREGGGEQ